MDLGLERAGMTCVAQVEIDPFCRQVLQKHWPDVPKFKDVRNVGKHNLPPADLIAGGFPCQPHSVAGKRKGASDDRNLWLEFRRIIAELQPRYILAENVSGIVTTYLDTVLSDLEDQGYTCATFNLPACAFDAPHRRERIFVIAHAQGNIRRASRDERSITLDRSNSFVADHAIRGRNQKQTPQERGNNPIRGIQRTTGGCSSHVDNAHQRRYMPSKGQICTGRHGPEHTGWWTLEPDVDRVAYGPSTELDRNRLGAIGNAVVPQVAEWIGRRIMLADGAA